MSQKAILTEKAVPYTWFLIQGNYIGFKWAAGIQEFLNELATVKQLLAISTRWCCLNLCTKGFAPVTNDFDGRSGAYIIIW